MNQRDILLAVFSGIALALIFPGPSLKELGWVCLVPLIAASYKKDPSKGFLLASIAGSVFHLGLIYWVTVSMTTYGKLPLAVSIIILMVFAVFLSRFIAVPLYLSCYVQKHLMWGFTLTLPFFWTTSEYIKSWIFTGFPWENLGYSQFQALTVIQIADITGVYGISFLMVLVNCVVFSLLQGIFIKKKLPWSETGITVLLVAVTLLYGQKRLNDLKIPQGSPVKVAVIQPNISQDTKWDPAFLDQTMNIFHRLTLTSLSENPDMVVWPESSTPFIYQDQPVLFNSAFLLSPQNRVEGIYNKVHLVPYGEYVPLQEFFPFIHKMVFGIGDFRPGKEIKNLALPGDLY